MADFEQALTIEPKNALSHNARGLLLEKMGRPDAALADFERAVQLDGAANVDFLRNRGLCFRARREYNKAVEDFDRCARRPIEALLWWQSGAEMTNSQSCFAVTNLQHATHLIVIIKSLNAEAPSLQSSLFLPAPTCVHQSTVMQLNHDVAGYCNALQQI